MESSGNVELVQEKKQDNLDYELLRKKRKALIVVMVCALVWLCTIPFAFNNNLDKSIGIYDKINEDVSNISNDGYQPGEEVIALFGVSGIIFTLFGGLLFAFLFGVSLFFAGAYLLMAVIAWILAFKNKKSAAVFGWICFILYALVLVVASLFSTLNIFITVFNVVGLIIAVLHVIYTVQYSKVFKMKKVVAQNN